MENLETIKSKVRRVVLEILPGISEDELSDDRDIFSLGLDSINAMNLIFSLQDTFNLSFDNSEIGFDNFRTVNIIAERVAKKLQ